MVSLTEPANQRIGLWHALRGRAGGWMRRQLTLPAESGGRAARVTQAGFVVWVPFWFGLGIAVWFAARFEPGVPAYGLAALCLLGAGGVFLRLTSLARRGLLGWRLADPASLLALSLALVAAGFLAVGLRSASVAAPIVDFRYYGAIEGRVVGIDRSSRDRMRLLLDDLAIERIAPHRTPAKVRISLMTEQKLPEAGARVMLTGHLGPPPGPAEPGGFDFRRTAWFEGVGAVGYTRSPVMVVEPAPDLGRQIMTRIRMHLSRLIQQEVPGQSGAIASALMTGDRSGISEATNEVMRVSSLYHIISISGLHMSMLAGLAYGALRLSGTLVSARAGRTDWPVHKAAAIGALLTAFVYLGLSGGGVATERAFLMVAVLLVAVLANKRVISLRNVALVALAILALAPEALTSASFQMSFAATVALILAHRHWVGIAPYVPPLFKPVAMLLFTSLVAGLATGPFAAVHFGRIAPYGMVANLLAVPVVGIIVMPMGLIAAILAPFGLAGPPLWLMGIGTGWMLQIAEAISALGGADLLVAMPPALALPLLGAGMTIAALSYEPRAAGGSPDPRWYARGFAAALVIAALVLWMGHERPRILVSAQGDAVGIMTQAGRAFSKPKGGAFSASNWLESDGDPVGQKVAAARLLWSGPKNRRVAVLRDLPEQRTVIHLTGKAPVDLSALCHGGAILISDQDLVPEMQAGGRDCRIFGRSDINAFGGFSFTPGPQVDRLETVNGVAGRRQWVR